MDDRDLYTRTIIDVIDHYGHAQVARRLNVRMDHLDRWIAGETRPPTAVFLQILELKARAHKLEMPRGATVGPRCEDVLSPEDFVEEKDVFRRAFCRNDDGSWTCTQRATFHPPAGRIRVTPGSRFYPGTKFMTFDLASWLEARLADTA